MLDYVTVYRLLLLLILMPSMHIFLSFEHFSGVCVFSIFCRSKWNVMFSYSSFCRKL